MSKYRFKTEEEFKKEERWGGVAPKFWVTVMNKYLGKDIPDSYNTTCDKQDQLHYETWSFNPKDYVLKETAFVLPSKWCIKVDRDCQPKEVYKWRQMSWSDTGYISYSKNWDHRVHSNHTEITFEQFKQHVLKESPVVESPKEIDMKDIQEEAKKRFPIGCKFIPVDGDNTYTLIEDDCTYTINCYSIWAHSIHGSLYTNGKWATLVSLPETTKEMFYAGDYIVTLDVEDGCNCARKNYCFKQRVNLTGMAPEVDLKGSTSNSHGVMSFGKKEWLKDWRYATPEEAAEYERIGKPYDVTTLQKKKASIPEYVECVSYFGERFAGKIYNTKIDTPEKNTSRSWEQILIENNRLEDSSFKPSTKEAYEAQFVSNSTVIKEWSEGTYAVGVKGNFGVYEGSTNPISVGRIFTVREDLGKDSISTKESSYWVYKENLRWFATYLEALDFSKELKASPVPKEFDYPVMPVDAYPSIKKETFIDNVQSVDVILRTKRKSIKF